MTPAIEKWAFAKSGAARPGVCSSKPLPFQLPERIPLPGIPPTNWNKGVEPSSAGSAKVAIVLALALDVNAAAATMA